MEQKIVFSQLRTRAGLSVYETSILMGLTESDTQLLDRGEEVASDIRLPDVLERLSRLTNIRLENDVKLVDNVTAEPLHSFKPPLNHEVIAKTRYSNVTKQKSTGATYTPANLAAFVAKNIVANMKATLEKSDTTDVLDPAIGDGELVVQLLRALPDDRCSEIVIHGFDTDKAALHNARQRISSEFPDIELQLQHENFLDYVADRHAPQTPTFFETEGELKRFDVVIANPPYVRTQVLGVDRAQELSKLFDLRGRVDIYFAFLIGIAEVLSPTGTTGLIVSNRFMTTKAGSQLRRKLREKLNLRHVWDLGDTKLFDVAVLPAVIEAHGKEVKIGGEPKFSSVYETKDATEHKQEEIMATLDCEGVIEIPDGRRFRITHGNLWSNGDASEVWRVTTKHTSDWLNTVKNHTTFCFGDIGKVRVGVKTCADKVFIRDDWPDSDDEKPELLKPLITHHGVRRFFGQSDSNTRQILYPHEADNGKKRAIDITKFKKSQAYLEKHRSTLERRKYVIDAGRNWYEIWVPQDPAAWEMPKLVFRDISVRPTFWIDFEGAVVNGDCYWMALKPGKQEDLLWLALAVANSTFIERFYDSRFNNKLYAGRRRFITQYVEQFPIPDPEGNIALEMINRVKEICACSDLDSDAILKRENELDTLVWQAFGLRQEKITR